MKRKKKFLMIIFMLAFFLMIGNVSAAEDMENMCTPTQLSELRSRAANVKVTYVPYNGVYDLGNNTGAEIAADKITRRFLDIKIFNVTDLLYVVARQGDKQYTLTHEGANSDGAVVLRQPSNSQSVINYTFEVYTTSEYCQNTILRTIKLTLPKYNQYSELDVCSDIPDYYLCQPYTTYSVSGGTFYDKVDEYKNKLSNLEEQKENNNTGFVSNTMSGISKYKYLIVGIVVAVGVVLTVFVIKKKRSAL